MCGNINLFLHREEGKVSAGWGFGEGKVRREGHLGEGKGSDKTLRGGKGE